MPKEKLLLQHLWALGDSVLLTALIRDIHKAYPGRFDIYAHAHYREVFANSGQVTAVKTPTEIKGARRVVVSYRDGIRASQRGNRVHMLSWYHHDFTRHTGIKVPVTEPCGYLPLDSSEQAPLIDGDYWLLLAGGKQDLTNKFWPKENWQAVVDGLVKVGFKCVQAGAKFKRNIHEPLDNVENVVGKWQSARMLFNLVNHAKGVICPVTAAMHIAACYDTPCVVISGGREEPWWEHYTDEYGAFGQDCRSVRQPHKFLHTIGQLPCCQKVGCWKHRTIPLGDNARHDQSLCERPEKVGDNHFAACMNMVTPSQVLEACMSDTKTETVKPVASNLKSVEDVRIMYPPSVDKREDADVVPVRVKNDPKDNEIYDNPVIGGKFTLCALAYGDNTHLIKQCLDSVLDSVPDYRLDIRVACNQVSKSTLKYLDTIPITKRYVDTGERRKYPAMREMFHDQTCPLATKYLLWFDDDTKIVDKNWLVRLSKSIVANHPHNTRLYGWRMVHDLQRYQKHGKNPKMWFERADWWRGRHMKVKGRNQEAANGTVIDFVSGWFWAIGTDAIKAAKIPDKRLNHNGGDITIGEQIHQAGYNIHMFNANKALIWTPKKEDGGRRGYSEQFPWA